MPEDLLVYSFINTQAKYFNTSFHFKQFYFVNLPAPETRKKKKFASFKTHDSKGYYIACMKCELKYRLDFYDIGDYDEYDMAYFFNLVDISTSKTAEKAHKKHHSHDIKSKKHNDNQRQSVLALIKFFLLDRGLEYDHLLKPKATEKGKGKATATANSKKGNSKK